MTQVDRAIRSLSIRSWLITLLKFCVPLGASWFGAMLLRCVRVGVSGDSNDSSVCHGCFSPVEDNAVNCPTVTVAGKALALWQIGWQGLGNKRNHRATAPHFDRNVKCIIRPGRNDVILLSSSGVCCDNLACDDSGQ